MITAEDTYDVADKVLELPVASIRPAADNVRADLGDLADLAASIREVGVLQPILVYRIPGSNDAFEILAGARRHGAAELAGALTIPAIVRPKPDEPARVIAMLIENVQRLDLTPLDEARTFARLEELGLTQVEIKDRVHCSQSHVSKRLILLDLPARAQAMVVAGTVNIGEAIELAKLVDAPDVLEQLLTDLPELDADERQWSIREAVDDVENARKLATAEAQWTAKGVEVIDAQQAARQHRLVEPGVYAGRAHLDLPAPAIKKHAKEPCHAVCIRLALGEVKVDEYCTNADRHGPKGDSKIKAIVEKVSKSGKNAEQVAREKRDTEIRRHRTEFVTTLVRSKKLDRARVTAIALREQALSGYQDQHEKRAKLLGLDLNGRKADQALADYVAGGTDAMIRACLASMLSNATSSYVNPATQTLLDELGYEPSPLELEERARLAVLDEERKAIQSASDALDQLLDLAAEHNVDDPRIDAFGRELDDGADIDRARAIEAEVAAMTAAIGAEDDDAIVDTLDPTVELNEDRVLCPFPGCELDDEHDGDHQVPADDVVAHGASAPAGPAALVESGVNGSLMVEDAPATAHPHHADYLKPPKDRGDIEAQACTRAEMAMHRWPDDPDVVSMQQELYRGVDEGRAAEILTACRDLLDQPLTDYQHEAINGGERTCRKLIEELDPAHPRVAEIQQQLYRGRVSITDAGVLRRELAALTVEQGTKA